MRKAVENFYNVQQSRWHVDPDGWKRKKDWAERRLRKNQEWVAEQDERKQWWCQEGINLWP